MVARHGGWLDPWAGLVAGVSGGLAWAVTAPATAAAVPLGLGVAAAVLGAHAAVTALSRRRREPAAPGEAELPEPERDSPAARWQARALTALAELREVAGPLERAPAAVVDVVERATGMERQVRRLAGQATAVARARRRITVSTLEPERDRLRERLARLEAETTSPRSAEIGVQLRSSLRSVEEQLAVAERLAVAHEALLARLQSTALGLEGLIARAAEVVAMSVTLDGGASGDRITELATALEGLRAGMVEAEQLSRRALGQ